MSSQQHKQRQRCLPSNSVLFAISIILSCIALVCIPLVQRDIHTAPLDYGLVLGIDLGPTDLVLAVHRGGVSEVIPNKYGHSATPAVASFTDGKWIFGQAALDNSLQEPYPALFNVSNLLQATIGHPSTRPAWLSNIVKGDGGNYLPSGFEPKAVVSMFLAEAKVAAEKYLNESVSHGVMTVPAYFTGDQRQEMKVAFSQLSGIKILRAISRPTSASIAHRLDKIYGEMTALVFHLSGETLEVSLLNVDDGVFEIIESNSQSGGPSYESLLHFVTKRCTELSGRPIVLDPLAVEQLVLTIDIALADSGSQDGVAIPVQRCVDGQHPSLIQLTRAQLNHLSAKLVEWTIEKADSLFEKSGLSHNDISRVIVTGGSPRISQLSDLIVNRFQKEPLSGVDPVTSAAIGAAIQGDIITSHDGENVGCPLIDVMPLSIGIETADGGFARIVERNCVIPTRRQRIITTAKDNQREISIRVLEGERTRASDNTLLGSLDLRGLRASKRGEPRILVTFEVDANYEIKVSATEENLGFSESIKIAHSMRGVDYSKRLQDAAAAALVDSGYQRELDRGRYLHALQETKRRLDETQIKELDAFIRNEASNYDEFKTTLSSSAAALFGEIIQQASSILYVGAQVLSSEEA